MLARAAGFRGNAYLAESNNCASPGERRCVLCLHCGRGQSDGRPHARPAGLQCSPTALGRSGSRRDGADGASDADHGWSQGPRRRRAPCAIATRTHARLLRSRIGRPRLGWPAGGDLRRWSSLERSRIHLRCDEASSQWRRCAWCARPVRLMMDEVVRVPTRRVPRRLSRAECAGISPWL